MGIAILCFPKICSALIFLALLILNLIVEYGYYKRWPIVYTAYHFLFGNMLRELENGSLFKLSGSPFVLASAFLSVILFEMHIASLAFSIMIVGDTAAALVGRKFGKIRFSNGKTLEGYLAFVITSLLVLIIYGLIFNYSILFIVKGVIGICLAGLVELYGREIRIDDNFSIPIVFGIIVSM